MSAIESRRSIPPRARQGKKDKIIIFFLHIERETAACGRCRRHQNILGEGLKKGQFFFSLGRTKAGPFPRLSPIVQG